MSIFLLKIQDNGSSLWSFPLTHDQDKMQIFYFKRKKKFTENFLCHILLEKWTAFSEIL